jgi:hypothetical protein
MDWLIIFCENFLTTYLFMKEKVFRFLILGKPQLNSLLITFTEMLGYVHTTPHILVVCYFYVLHTYDTAQKRHCNV